MSSYKSRKSDKSSSEDDKYEKTDRLYKNGLSDKYSYKENGRVKQRSPSPVIKPIDMKKVKGNFDNE